MRNASLYISFRVFKRFFHTCLTGRASIISLWQEGPMVQRSEHMTFWCCKAGTPTRSHPWAVKPGCLRMGTNV